MFKFEDEHFTSPYKQTSLDVSDSKDVEGQTVKLAKRTNGANQRWKVIYTDKVTTQTQGLNKNFGFEMNRPFYIVSRLPMGRVLELQPSKGPVRIRNYIPNKKSQ